MLSLGDFYHADEGKMAMNSTQEQLKKEIERRLQASFSKLSRELNWLQDQGLLTPLDKEKILATAEINARAIHKALVQTDYPEQLQRELLMRLITQFENATKEIADKARSRVYTTKYINQKFLAIENMILEEFGILTKRPDFLETTDWKRIKNGYIKQMQSKGRNGAPDISQINRIYQEFEDACRRYIVKSLLQIKMAGEKNRLPMPVYTSLPPKVSYRIRLSDALKGECRGKNVLKKFFCKISKYWWLKGDNVVKSERKLFFGVVLILVILLYCILVLFVINLF